MVGGRHFFISSDEDNKEDAHGGRATRPSDPWLAPVDAFVECDLVLGGYIDPNCRGKPLP